MKEINNKFEIGEQCWTYYRKHLDIECPVCKGNKYFVYDGYDIPCKQCNSSGRISTDINVVAPVLVEIKRIIANIFSNDKVSIKYKVDTNDFHINVRNRQESTLYKTKKEVLQVCKDINQQNIGADL